MNIETKKLEEKVIKDLCTKIYRNFTNNHVDIFLCGGDIEQNSIRKKIKDLLKEKYIMIFYPERVFVEYFNLNKKSDYLALETILAQNVDYICIVCESAGSLVELGAFANNSEIRDKIIALNDEKYKKEKSFINLGPIKHLLNNNKNSVKFYTEDTLEQICEGLKKTFRQKLKTHVNARSIDKITGMFYFICLLLYFFKYLEKGKLYNFINYAIKNVENIQIEDLKARYYATEKILLELINKNEKIIYNSVISDI